MSRDPVVIDVARDFTTTPGGRYRAEGDFSGQEFREDIVQPKIDAGESIVIDLDGPVGFTTSFLEEVFGGLIRRYGPSIERRVQARAMARPSRAKKAQSFIERAKAIYGK